jgi:hypothetical protein
MSRNGRLDATEQAIAAIAATKNEKDVICR